MKYKGYQARIEYSDEDQCFVGRVIGIRDMISFHGNSVEEVKIEFHGMIDFYLEDCAKLGRDPAKSFSGKFVLRLSSDEHKELALEAERKGQSLNQLVRQKLFGSKAA